MQTIKSNYEHWDELYKHWVDDRYSRAISSLKRIRLAAEAASRVANQTGDIGSVTNDLLDKDINDLEEIQEALADYAKRVHDEIGEIIDMPFWLQLQGYIRSLYLLNPNDIEVTKTNYPYNLYSGENLHDLIDNLGIDSELAKDYKSALGDLDVDAISDDLLDSINRHIGSWRDEVTFEDMKEIDRILWSNRESKAIEGYFGKDAQETADAILDSYYRYSAYWYLVDNDVVGTQYYSGDYNGAFMNMPNEKDNPRNPYTTWFHEYGHWTDNNAVDLEKGVSLYHDSDYYISTGPYAKTFYDAIQADCEAVRKANSGIAKDALDEIGSVVTGSNKSARVSEFTDLMGAVYKYNQKDGYYGHSDSYWSYDSSGKPNQARLNKEAFAHFTEITIMQDPNDLKILEKYFPNSYQVYLDMMKDAVGGNK
ncbi:MAG: hypothetical protein K0R34_667 [Herbinix sp.]|jgi:hypothetical protein|nr:hypothetical protein [Herbinix sp.]